MAEIMCRANCDRAHYLGDPAFVQIPDKLVCPRDGLSTRRHLIDLRKAGTRSESLLAKRHTPLSPEGENTTHLSIIDRNGEWRWPTRTRWNLAFGARAS